MAQANRMTGKQFDYFWADTTTPDTSDNFGSVVADWACTFNVTTVTPTALKDDWEYPIGVRGNATMEVTLLVDVATAITATPNAIKLLNLVATNTPILIIAQSGPATSAAKVSGTFIGTAGAYSIGDGPQTIKLTLQSQGAVTIAASS